MTGGSINKNSGLHFGTVSTEESGEIKALKSRLQEIGEILAYCFQYITEKSVLVNELTHKLTEIKQEKERKSITFRTVRKRIKSSFISAKIRRTIATTSGRIRAF
jgi:chromosome segregation protein